jgi:hypothetical protein
MSENEIVVEMHGCIVCARKLKVLAVYTPDGNLVGCTVTSITDGHCVPGERQLLVACDIHTAEEIEAAHQRWQARNDPEVDDEKVDQPDGA